MTGALSGTIRHGFHRAAIPLAWYYAITLGVPLANGAVQFSATFVRHAVTVLVVPPIAIVLVSVLYGLVLKRVVSLRPEARDAPAGWASRAATTSRPRDHERSARVRILTGVRDCPRLADRRCQ
jgi:hypothetical protein